MRLRLDPETQPDECKHCGERVKKRFRRVFGDSEDRAHRCYDCDTGARICRGSAAGLDVDIPDPENAPGRHGNDSEEAQRWKQ